LVVQTVFEWVSFDLIGVSGLAVKALFVAPKMLVAFVVQGMAAVFVQQGGMEQARSLVAVVVFALVGQQFVAVKGDPFVLVVGEKFVGLVGFERGVELQVVGRVVSGMCAPKL